MKTLLIGNFGDHNLGDELILSAALEKYPNAIVMTSDPIFSKNFTEQDFVTVPFPPTGIRSWWKFMTKRGYSQDILKLRLRGIDQVVFAGGGLFAIKWKACFLWWCVFRFVKKAFPRADIRFEHQGVDQGLGFLSKKYVQYVFDKTDFISVRDQPSGEALASLSIEDYVVSEDRVWAWLKRLSIGATVASEKLVLVNALSVFDIASIEKKYPDHEIIFIPLALSDLSVLPDDFVHEIIFPKTKTELFELLVRAEVLIGERFHSLVLGAHFCGPEKTFSLKQPYSEKAVSFCEKQGIKRFA